MGAKSQACVTERYEDATCLLDDTHVSAYANVYTPDHTPANASTIYMHSRMFAHSRAHAYMHTRAHAHTHEHPHTEHCVRGHHTIAIG